MIDLLQRPDGWSAVDKLVEMTSKGDRSVVDALISKLDTHGSPVVEALSRIAEKGDVDAIAAIGARLQVEQDTDTRLVIVRALHQLATWGHESILRILRGCFGEE